MPGRLGLSKKKPDDRHLFNLGRLIPFGGRTSGPRLKRCLSPNFCAALIPAWEAFPNIGPNFADKIVRPAARTAVRQAIAGVMKRLGAAADGVLWIAGDIAHVELPEHRYAFWHDRAVFHFLRDAVSRRRYAAALRRGLSPTGHIVVATFGPAGPERCSGLDVVGYSADRLHAEFGDLFIKVARETGIHTTPWGTEQEFVHCYCRMTDSAGDNHEALSALPR